VPFRAERCEGWWRVQSEWTPMTVRRSDLNLSWGSPRLPQGESLPVTFPMGELRLEEFGNMAHKLAQESNYWRSTVAGSGQRRPSQSR